MENTRKWTGWIWAAAILLITLLVLGIYTLGGKQAGETDALGQYEKDLRTLFNDAESFERADSAENILVFRAVRSGNAAGYAAVETVQGYAGPVEVITALSSDGAVQGIRVGGSGFSETEGLGAKAREPGFTDQFKGKQLPVTLGQDIDAIAGATVTSQAVVDAVNRSQERLANQPGMQLSPATTTEPAGDVSGLTANASAIGYGGPVLVRLTLDDQGKIAALDIGGARFAETEGVGSRVKDDGFAQTFIGLTPPVALGEDVDAISGATISSQAVVDAVNDAAAFLTQKNDPSDSK